MKEEQERMQFLGRKRVVRELLRLIVKTFSLTLNVFSYILPVLSIELSLEFIESSTFGLKLSEKY